MHGGQQLGGIFSAGTGSTLTAWLVTVAEFLQPPVALPAIGDDGCTRLDMIRDEGVE